MAMSLNRVQLIGDVTRDPEIKQIPGGSSVASFGVATNFTWTDAQGNKQTKAEFHNIVAWRKLADICNQYLKKGTKAYIEGRLQTRSWQDQNGVTKYRTEIIADNMIMLDRAGDGQNFHTSSGNFNTNISEGSQPEQEQQEEEIKIEDIPF